MVRWLAREEEEEGRMGGRRGHGTDGELRSSFLREAADFGREGTRSLEDLEFDSMGQQKGQSWLLIRCTCFEFWEEGRSRITRLRRASTLRREK